MSVGFSTTLDTSEFEFHFYKNVFFFSIISSVIVAKMTKYSWVPLNQNWVAILNSDKFREKECKGDGNCQFRSIAQAFKDANIKMSHKDLGKMLSNTYINFRKNNLNLS
jgi:hypothetical protein